MWSSTFHIVTIYLLLKIWSLLGCAIAYVVHNLMQILVSMLVANRLTGFSWSSGTTKMLWVFTPLVVCCFLATTVLTEWQVTLSGGLGTAAISFFCLRHLTHRLGPQHRLSLFAEKIPVIGRFLVGY